MQYHRAAASISPMITEPASDRTLHVSIVVYQSALPRLRSTLIHLVEAARNALSAGAYSLVKVSLVDNASGSEYRAALRNLAEQVRTQTEASFQIELSELHENLGFGAGHNHALLNSTAEHLLILNPDVELAADALVKGDEAFCNNVELMAINPCSSRESGEPEFLCKRYPTLLLLLLRGISSNLASRLLGKQLQHYEYRDRPRDEEHAVTLLSGACYYCRGSAFTAVGGFDAGYFLYFEDFDLSLRMRALGRLHYYPQMQIVHYGGNAAKKGRHHIFWFLRSAARFFTQHGFRVD